MSGAVLPLVVLALLGAGMLVACGGSNEIRSACTSVRGGPEDPVSLWRCESDEQVVVLRDEYGFTSCDLVQGMDAEATLEDRAYQCRK